MNESLLTERPSRLISWLVIALALLSLAIVAKSALTGHGVVWTSWLLPLLLIGNAWVFFLRGLGRWKNMERIYYVASVVVAVAIIVWQIAH
jgi:hypothetical protein